MLVVNCGGGSGADGGGGGGAIFTYCDSDGVGDGWCKSESSLSPIAFCWPRSSSPKNKPC